MRLRPLAVAVILLAAPVARAQVGTGWVPYDPPSTIHLDGANGIESSPGTSTNVKNMGASFTNEGGIETFSLFNPISNRSERRMQNTYLTGKRQFEGEVRVSPPTDDESVMQVFGGNSGATTQMIRAYNTGGGTLRKVPGSVTLAENIHGTWIKVNVIHDVGANFVKTYINGKLLTTGDGEATNAGTDGWYHKYGCYGTLRTGSAKVEWRNVKHFRDGNSPPGNGTPIDAGSAPADAGDPRPDAGRDPEPTPDAGSTGGSSGGTGGTTGGSGGTTGGTGGKSGTGGSSGTGGAPGAATGGSSGEEEEPEPPKRAAAKGGCGYGSGTAGLLPILAALCTLGLVRRRRAR
jgi:hypothetical protein